jgi:hypothetical protein
MIWRTVIPERCAGIECDKLEILSCAIARHSSRLDAPRKDDGNHSTLTASGCSADGLPALAMRAALAMPASAATFFC